LSNEYDVDQANVAVLIVSADFLASDFVRTNELPPLLKAAEEEGALILPIIASPSLFLRTPALAQSQAVNSPSAPLVSLTAGDQEAIFVEVAEAILERATSARRRPSETDIAEAETISPSESGATRIFP
ncbi:MAG TPA: hypothetical protein VK548_18505, partial [Candidatus Acidoferrum sp.]|nr:hypothetical protein [Candidatus Acidoferrum sp.]